MNAQAEQYLTYRVFVSDIRPIVTDNRPSDTSQPTWLIVADPLEGGLIELEGHALPPPYQPRRALVLGPRAEALSCSVEEPDHDAHTCGKWTSDYGSRQRRLGDVCGSPSIERFPLVFGGRSIYGSQSARSLLAAMSCVAVDTNGKEPFIHPITTRL